MYGRGRLLARDWLHDNLTHKARCLIRVALVGLGSMSGVFIGDEIRIEVILIQFKRIHPKINNENI